jgi:hypothetical protein
MNDTHFKLAVHKFHESPEATSVFQAPAGDSKFCSLPTADSIWCTADSWSLGDLPSGVGATIRRHSLRSKNRNTPVDTVLVCLLSNVSD